MAFFRLSGKFLLVLAYVLLARDGVRMLATPSEGLNLTSIEAMLRSVLPMVQQRLSEGVSAHAPVVWTYLLEPTFALPASVVLGCLGSLFYVFGYRRPSLQIVEE